MDKAFENFVRENPDRVEQVAELAVFLIDFNTDPAIAAMAGPSDSADWSEAIESYAAGIAAIVDSERENDPQFLADARAFVDECFVQVMGRTPAAYAARHEASWLETAEEASPKRYDEICEEYFRDHESEPEADPERDEDSGL